MFEIGIDILRAVVIGAIFLYLRSLREKEQFHFRKGWILILIGVGLLFLASLLDITDNFPYLSRYVIIGKTKYVDFMEEVVGYLFGFVFVAIGFWKWMPAILALRREKKDLEKSHLELKSKIEELTAELHATRAQLEESKSQLQECRLSQQEK